MYSIDMYKGGGAEQAGRPHPQHQLLVLLLLVVVVVVILLLVI